MKKLILRFFFYVVFVFGLSLVLTSCSEEAPEGTAYFILIKYESSGLPYAAWVSTNSCSTGSKSATGYDDNANMIFNEKLDTDATNDKKVLEEKCLDVAKSGAFYKVYSKIWRGKAPDKQFLANISEDDLAEFGYEPNGTKIIKVEQVSKQIKTQQVEMQVRQIEKAYTYKIDRRRDEYNRYKSVIVRNDNIEIISLNTELEAKELLKYLK